MTMMEGEIRAEEKTAKAKAAYEAELRAESQAVVDGIAMLHPTLQVMPRQLCVDVLRSLCVIFGVSTK